MPAPFALPAGPVPADAADVLRILGLAYRPGRLTHVARVPARDGRQASWPSWVPAELVAALSARRRPALAAPGSRGPPSPFRAQRDHCDISRLRQVTRVPASRTGKRSE